MKLPLFQAILLSCGSTVAAALTQNRSFLNSVSLSPLPSLLQAHCLSFSWKYLRHHLLKNLSRTFTTHTVPNVPRPCSLSECTLLWILSSLVYLHFLPCSTPRIVNKYFYTSCSLPLSVSHLALSRWSISAFMNWNEHQKIHWNGRLPLARIKLQ